MSRNHSKPRGPAPWLFLVATLGWTWCFLLPAVFSEQGLFEFPVAIFSAIGLLGPLIVAGMLIAGGRWDRSLDATVGHFFRRCFDPRTLPWRWMLAVMGLAALLAVGPVFLDLPVLREQGVWEPGPLAFVLLGFLGALEEPGWRGYAQEGLQRRIPVVAAGFVIGVFWALWHLPLFFIDGTYQAGLGPGSVAFWGFMLALVVGAPFYAWLYNAAGKVVFAALLYHGLGNVARELVPDVSVFAEVAVEAAMMLVVVIIGWHWMKRSADTDQSRKKSPT